MQLVKLSTANLPPSPVIQQTAHGQSAVSVPLISPLASRQELHHMAPTSQLSHLAPPTLSSQTLAPPSQQAIVVSNPAPIQQPTPRPRPKNLPDRAVEIMLAWWNEHIDYPFPTESERITLALAGQISATQVRQWFANRRMRASVKKTRTSSGVGSNGSAAKQRSTVPTMIDINNNSSIHVPMDMPKTDKGSTIERNELDKYSESIDLVIKSLDNEVTRRIVCYCKQLTELTANVVKMNRSKTGMFSQALSAKCIDLWSSINR